MAAPTLILEIFEIDDAAQRHSIGTVDFADAVVRHMAPYRSVRRMERPPTLQSIQSALTQEQRSLAWNDRLRIPGMTEAIDAFVDLVGMDNMVPLREHFDEVGNVVRRRERIERLRSQVEVAALGTAKDCEHFMEVDGGDSFVDDVSNAYSTFGWDEFVAIMPRPDFDSPEEAAWYEGYSIWKQQHAPNFVFATEPRKWEGLSAASIREEFKDNSPEDDDEDEEFSDELRVDVDSMIGSGVEEHFEEAYEYVAGVDAAIDFVSSWERHAGSGDEVDLSLEAWIDAWNAKQTIVTHYTRNDVVVPVRDGIGKDDMLAWCDRSIAAIQQTIDAMNESWTLEQPVAQPA